MHPFATAPQNNNIINLTDACLEQRGAHTMVWFAPSWLAHLPAPRLRLCLNLRVKGLPTMFRSKTETSKPHMKSPVDRQKKALSSIHPSGRGPERICLVSDRHPTTPPVLAVVWRREEPLFPSSCWPARKKEPESNRPAMGLLLIFNRLPARAPFPNQSPPGRRPASQPPTNFSTICRCLTLASWTFFIVIF